MERILCAAIWYKEQPQVVNHYNPININKGIVLCGHRHHNIIGQCLSLTDKKQYEMGEYVQGFITTKNRFLDRKEAAILWKEQGNTLQCTENELFSEDLY